jgi:hypothetical protein
MTVMTNTTHVRTCVLSAAPLFVEAIARFRELLCRLGEDEEARVKSLLATPMRRQHAARRTCIHHLRLTTQIKAATEPENHLWERVKPA